MIGYAEIDEGRELGSDLSGEIAELFAIFCEAADGVGICGIVGLTQKRKGLAFSEGLDMDLSIIKADAAQFGVKRGRSAMPERGPASR